MLDVACCLCLYVMCMYVATYGILHVMSHVAHFTLFRVYLHSSKELHSLKLRWMLITYKYGLHCFNLLQVWYGYHHLLWDEHDGGGCDVTSDHHIYHGMSSYHVMSC